MKTLRSLSLILLVVALASCESKTFLRSKKKLNKDIQGQWRPIFGTSKYGSSVYDENVQWKFADGEVQIVRVDGNGNNTIIDKGTYAISTKVDNCFVTISDLTTNEYAYTFGFNIKWNIIQLTGDVLDLAGRPNNGGMVEIEFTKSQ